MRKTDKRTVQYALVKALSYLKAVESGLPAMPNIVSPDRALVEEALALMNVEVEHG